MWVVPSTVAAMKQKRLFIEADAALREVIDQLTPEQLDLPVPAAWSQKKNPTLRDILASHAYDEAWVPDLLAGRTIDEVGDAFSGDLLGADPIRSYDAFHDRASDAIAVDVLPSEVVHFTYGDYPVAEGLEHITWYRAFQAPLIAKLAGIEFTMSDDLIDGLYEQVTPQLEFMRSIGVFPPEIEAPAGANRETQLLCLVGYYTP